MVANVLVIGSATVEFLSEMNGSITLIAPRASISPAVFDLITQGKIAWFNRTVQDFDIQGKTMVFDFTFSSWISELARDLGVLYYAPTTHPSYLQLTRVSVGNLQLYVSTNGQAPLLEESMSQYLSSLIPPFFQLSVKKMNLLSTRLNGEHKDEFLKYIADTWYLNTISRLSDEQIDLLVYLFENGTIHPTTDMLLKDKAEKAVTFETVSQEKATEKKVSSSASLTSFSSDEQDTVGSKDYVVEKKVTLKTIASSLSLSSDGNSTLDTSFEAEKLVKPVSILERKRVEATLKRSPHNKIIDGSTAVSQVAYQFSDIAFLYPLFKTKFLGESMVTWSNEKVLNAKGVPTKVINQITDIGAGETVIGALKAGSTTSVLLNSTAIGAMLPAMYNIVRDGQYPVFHVATTTINDELVLESTHADIHKAIHTGFIILASSTVQEAHDVAVAAHVAARELKKPILHFMDGVKVVNQKASINLLSKEDIKKLELIRTSDDRKDLENVKDILSKVSNVLGRNIHPFEYFGSKDAKIVLVSMGWSVSVIKKAVVHLVKNSQPVGFVQVGLYKPWSAETFLSVLPSTVERIVVVDDEAETGNSPLGIDVDSSFYGHGWNFTVPNVFMVSFDSGIHHRHPAAVQEFIGQYIQGKTPLKIQHIQLKSHSFVDSGVVEAIFWDRVVDETAKAVDQLVYDIHESTAAHVQTYTQHLSTLFDPISVSHVRYSQSEIDAEHLVDHAKVMLVNDLSAVQGYDFVATIQRGGYLFVNSSLKKEEILESLPSQLRHSLVKKQVQLFIVDANKISQNYTIFFGNAKEYLGDIITAIFYTLAFNENESKVLLNAFLKRIETTNSDLNVVYTKKEAIYTALKELKSLGPLQFAVDHQEENQARLPVFVRGTVPSKSVFDPATLEPVTDVELRVVPKYQALLPVIFPSAFKVSHKLRPDIDGGYQVKVTENIRLTPSTYDRNVFHMELDISGTGLKYEIGDALGVYAQNNLEEVHHFLKVYGAEADQLVFIDRPDPNGNPFSEVRTIEQLFVHNLDIFGKPGKKFYQYLAAKSTLDEHKEEIAHLIADNDKFEQYVNDYTPTFADLLIKYHSARPPVQELIRVIPATKPRHYSIASSQKMHPNSVHLLIVVVDWVSKDGIKRFGQATRFLVNAKIGDTLTVSVKPSVMKLPPSLEAPVIMSGLGTGMAPFRAFIEERWYWKQQGKKVGPMVLYFGSRNRANEYLYGEELEAYHDEGILTHLRLAFSRDQPQKIYIQHKIQEDAVILHDMMVKQDGAFYLCGPTWPVPDVTDALLHSFTKSLTIDEAKEFLEHLKQDERFVLEVY